MAQVTKTLLDGKEYGFGEIGIGYFRRFRAAATQSDSSALETRGLEIITRSLQSVDPSVTAEQVENELVSPATFDETIQAAMEASSVGEKKPVAKA